MHGAGTLTLNRRKDTEEMLQGQTDFGVYVYSALILDLKAIEEYIDVNSKLRKRLLLKCHGLSRRITKLLIQILKRFYTVFDY